MRVNAARRVTLLKESLAGESACSTWVHIVSKLLACRSGAGASACVRLF